MSSDIKLDGRSVIIEGSYTKLKTLDLILDAPSRRKNNNGVRRALVHDQNDGLTVNYNADYPGGVTIKGKTKIDLLTAGSVKAGQFNLAYSSISNLVLGDSNAPSMTELEGPGLRLKGALRVYQNAIFDEPVQTPDIIIKPKTPAGNEGDHPRYRKYNLTDKLQGLQEENKKLQNQITKLAKRVQTLEER